MKHLLLSVFILLAFQTVRAQYRGDFNDKQFFISAGGEIGAPSNTPYNFTYGASATLEVKPISRIGITLTGEYSQYSYKNVFLGTSSQPHPSFIPLKAGVKYYTSPNFYLQGELGSTIKSNNERDDNLGNMVVYSLGFGFEIPLDKHSDIDVGFMYQNYAQNQYQTTGLKVAYRVGW